MKDIDLGKEYVIPSPGYRNVRETSPSEQHCLQAGLKYSQTKPQDPLVCQDALEAAARAEGLPLDVSVEPKMRILDGVKKGKYHHGFSLLKPIRTTHKHTHPVDNAGLFSFTTFSWLTPLAHLAYKKEELFFENVWPLSDHESSEINSRRLNRLWQVELKEHGREEASLRRAVWQFCRTRLCISVVCLMLSQLAGFIGPYLGITD